MGFFKHNNLGKFLTFYLCMNVQMYSPACTQPIFSGIKASNSNKLNELRCNNTEKKKLSFSSINQTIRILTIRLIE